MCISVTCHLHFWQNDRDRLRATAVTRGWNGYRNKSQHRKLTLEMKILLPSSTPALEPATSRVRRSTGHWAAPLPPPLPPPTPNLNTLVLKRLVDTCRYEKGGGRYGSFRAQELCKSGGRPGFPSLINLRFLRT